MGMKFSQDALLNAAATIVAARLQAPAAGSARKNEDVSQMLMEAMTEVLGGVELMEDQAKTEGLDLWGRLSE